MSHWEHFSHIADIGVRGYGSTLAQSFEQAALALTAVISDPKLIVPHTEIEINCHAPDQELLLPQWLNCLIYEMSTRGMLFSKFEIQIDHLRLTATLAGEAVDQQRHMPAVEVKGATYTELRVSQDEMGIWVAQCVVDV